MRLVFAAKNYVTGQTVNFKVYDENNLIFDDTGTEWGTTGNYYIDISLVPTKLYLVIATEANNVWKASRYVIGGVDIGDYISDLKYNKQDNTETVMTTDVFQTKLEVSKVDDNIIEGNYLLNWQIESYNNTKDGANIVKIIDNLLNEYNYNGFITPTASSIYKTISGFSLVTFDEFKTNYYLQIAQSVKGTAYFRRARICLSGA